MIKKYLLLVLKGMGMGAADVVPGVSGGTIAFISGIYEELIYSLKSVDAAAVSLFFRGRFRDFWMHINGSFLLAVFAGIIISALSLAGLISYLLAEYPVLIWSFFFGLIVGSAIMVGRKVRRWTAGTWAALLAGALLAWGITSMAPAHTPEAAWFVFLSGMIAISAMILPGISGSFILLLLGKYKYILDAVASLDMKTILIFILGCVAGLLSFSRLLAWMFRKFHDLTVALLTGFMIGSLNKVWPWKTVLEWFADRHGKMMPLLEKNVWPAQYEGEAQLPAAVLLALAAFIMIVWLESLGSKKEA